MNDKKKRQQTRVNRDIRAPEVRLIGADGSQLGIVSSRDAYLAAQDAGLDLVEISPYAAPPVCKIMDFGKYKFDQKKKLQAGKKTRVKLKEIKLRPNTDIGDYEVKLRNLMGFIEHGDKVKVSIRFRGREIAHQQLGMELLKRLESDVGEAATIEARPKMEGRQLIMVFAPKSTK